MSDLSAILALPYLQPAQAQKHVTHNEALQMLDVLVQLAVLDDDRSVPPALPDTGDRHIIGLDASGAWEGRDRQIAVWLDGSWRFFTPRPGWQAAVLADGTSRVFDGTDWRSTTLVPQLGIQTTPDDTNRLAVASPATLLTHAGDGHQLKINKADPGETASLLFQSNWSGRAELGLCGSDSLTIKVSEDGSSWISALTVSPSTGQLGGAAVTQSPTDATTGRLVRIGDFGLGGAAPAYTATASLDDILDSGSYTISGSFSQGPNGVGPSPYEAALWVIRRTGSSGASLTQLLSTSGSEAALWVRVASGAVPVWSPWSRLISQNAILGPVSQSAGIATGAVIERGANANGDYVRFADGTQICSSPAFVADSSTAVSGTGLYRWASNQTWIYPATFVAAPIVSAAGQSNAQTCWASCGAPSLTGVALCATTTQSQLVRTVRATATGRWF